MQAVLLLSTLSAITVLEIASGKVNLVPMTLSDSSREISIFGDVFGKYYRHNIIGDELLLNFGAEFQR